jgi:hypothetical protein
VFHILERRSLEMQQSYFAKKSSSTIHTPN